MKQTLGFDRFMKSYFNQCYDRNDFVESFQTFLSKEEEYLIEMFREDLLYIIDTFNIPEDFSDESIYFDKFWVKYHNILLLDDIKFMLLALSSGGSK